MENFYNQSTRNKIENVNNKNFNLVKIKSIKIENLSFDYDNLNKIIKNLNENINLNDMVCIIGPSGSGKTTLVDLIMGLLKPNKGNAQFIDDNNNQKIIQILLIFPKHLVFLKDLWQKYFF